MSTIKQRKMFSIAKPIFSLLLVVSISHSIAAAELPRPAQAQDQALLDQLRCEPKAPPPRGSEQYERYHFHFYPSVCPDPKTGEIKVDLERIKTEIIPELRGLGFNVDEMLLETDGGKIFSGQDIPIPLDILKQDHPSVTYQGGPTNRQQYVRVVLKERGREIHVTDNAIIEKLNFPKIDPETYADYREAQMSLPNFLRRRSGMDPNLVLLAGQIQHRNVVWYVPSSSQNKVLREAFSKYGSDLRPVPARDLRGRWIGWQVAVPGLKEPIQAGLGDVAVKGGAAFSQHSFYWDEHFLAEARSNSDPKLAIDTLRYWLEAQQPDGSIGRELDYKGTPYHRQRTVKYGVTVVNADFFNPPLSGWAWHEVLRWSPALTAADLPRVIQVMRKQRQWLLKEYGVYGGDGRLVGFHWDNHGSGRDNAPRPLDEMGMDALSKYGVHAEAAKGREKRGLAVDLLAQYKTLLDHEREFLEILGKFNEADQVAMESQEIAELLQKRYYNKRLGWYVDLVPVGEKDWEQTDIVTAAGLWPVAAKAATREEVDSIIRNYVENPDKFGGPIFPSLAKDNPYYDEMGAYWRGGGWPSDWEMAARAVLEYGFRVEAAKLTERHMAAMTTTSEAYARGDSPKFMARLVDEGQEKEREKVRARIDDYFRSFWTGKIHNPEETGPGTVFEFYGLRRDSKGNPVPTYGEEIRWEHNNTLHPTRTDFAGWGAVVPLRSAHYICGLDAVPAFLGSDADLAKWLYSLFSDPELKYHQLGNIPDFKSLAEFARSRPKTDFNAFEAELKRIRTPEMDGQIALLRRGYIELSPTFDPATGETALHNYVYDGIQWKMTLDQKNDGSMEITVESPSKLRLQFNRNWSGVGRDSEAIDAPVESSPIFEIGEDQPSVSIKDGKVLYPSSKR
jgi:hypothetical protein